MAKEYKVNTNTFSIAHYILLFLVTILCIGIISWVMIRRNNPAPQNNIQTIDTYAHQTDPCVHRITNTVAKMWAYNPDMIPERYWDIAMQYLDETITTRTYGLCQDVAFTCLPGQRRRDCDPCAVPSARAYAQARQTADLIQQHCPTSHQSD